MGILISSPTISEITGTVAIVVPAPTIISSGVVDTAPGAITGTASVSVPAISTSITGTVGTATTFNETWGENTTDDHQSVTIDTRIKLGSPTTNYGTSDTLNCERDGDAVNEWMSLIRFDLTALPVDAAITSATLSFKTFNVPTITNVLYGFECLRNDWDRLQSTWNEYKTGSNWSSGGCRGNGTDITGDADAQTGAKLTLTIPLNTPTSTTVTSTDFASYVDSLIRSSNFILNIALHPSNPQLQHNFIYSSRATDGLRPILSLTYKSVSAGGGGAGPGALGRYVVWTDGKIYDPTGTLFTPRGGRSYATQPGATTATWLPYLGSPGWDENIIGLSYFPPGNPNGPTSITTYESALEAFTNAGKVVWIAWQNTGGYATSGGTDPKNLENLVAFYTARAAKYKNNNKVWYGVYNEPGGTSDTTAAGVWSASRVTDWITMCRAVITAVRGESALAPIVIPSMYICQDLAAYPAWNWGAAFGVAVGDRSSILKNGASILTGFEDASTGVTNAVFDVHLYGNYATVARQTGLDEFLAECASRGIAVLFGEYGNGATVPGHIQSAKNMHALRATRYFADTFYSNDAGDQNNVCTSGPSGRGSIQDINSLTSPTNLTALGKIGWDGRHPDAFPPGSFS